MDYILSDMLRYHYIKTRFIIPKTAGSSVFLPQAVQSSEENSSKHRGVRINNHSDDIRGSHPLDHVVNSNCLLFFIICISAPAGVTPPPCPCNASPQKKRKGVAENLTKVRTKKSFISNLENYQSYSQRFELTVATGFQLVVMITNDQPRPNIDLSAVLRKTRK